MFNPRQFLTSHLSTRNGICVVLLACMLGLSGSAAGAPADATTVPQADWPDFRGPTHDGNAGSPGLPVEWSETENVRWKTAIPHSGLSSPVVQKGQIWLTTATEDGHDFFVICVDSETGKIRFNKKIFHADNPEPLGNGVNGYASPSPVLEAGRVYVHFGSYGTACLDALTGKPLWERSDLACRHYRGPGSSPIIYEDLLVLSFDGVDVQYVTALDKTTGETVWKTDRTTVWSDWDEDGKPKREGDYRKAFCTPLVIDVAGGPQLISLGAAAGFSYHPRTGAEIWKIQHGGHSASPRPLFGNGLLHVVTGHGQTELWAMRVDGKGDVSDTHVAWKVTGKDVPKQPSPLLVDGLLYMVSNNGMVTCLEADTGAEVWKERIGGSFMASPILADGRIYVSSMQGKTTVLKAGRSAEVLAVNELEGSFLASPAVSGKALFLRSKTHLYRIEGK